MALTVNEAAQALGFESWMPHQQEYLEECAKSMPRLSKTCLYFPTGSGKTETMLAGIAVQGFTRAYVVAPPITLPRWEEVGRKLGVEVIGMSHAKFRMKTTKFDRFTPMVIDEFHMLGGHTGQGWTKADRMAAGMMAPLVIGSATPNYNDAERVYCIAHVLDPLGNKGGFLNWVYTHCETEANPYGSLPLVKGFRNFTSAEAMLMSMPGVYYLEDTAPDILKDYEVPHGIDEMLTKWKLDLFKQKMVASDMELRHAKRARNVVALSGRLRGNVKAALEELSGHHTADKVLLYVDHASFIPAVREYLDDNNANYVTIDGSISQKEKERRLNMFLMDPAIEIMLGTASMATGTDGIDKVADLLIIIDDTDDDSLRKQLVGRILPRGVHKDYSNKAAYRLQYT